MIRKFSSFFSSSQLSADDISALEVINGISNLFWLEKLVLLIDYLQLYGLLWNAANPWGFPYLFTVWTRQLNYFNIDMFSLTKGGALAGQNANIGISKWGTMTGYGNYALWFALSQAVLLVAYLCLMRVFGAYGKKWNKYKAPCAAFVFCLTYLFYLPAGLATFRLYYCDPGNGVLSADHSMICPSVVHSIYTSCCTLLLAPSFLGLPYLLYVYSNEAVVFKSLASDHEKHVQISEIRSMLDLESHYLESQMWIVSSFRLTGAYFRFHMTILKGSLLFVFLFLRFNMVIQAACFWFLIVVFCGRYATSRLPFRSGSSNMMMLILFAVLIANTSFAVINSFGVKNAVTVSSVESLWLLAINVTGGFLLIVLTVLTALNPLESWPTMATLHRIRSNSKLLHQCARWIRDLRKAVRVRQDFVRAAVQVADIRALEQVMERLRKDWLSAKFLGSIFAPIIGECLEELVIIHSQNFPDAYRRKPYWDTAYLQSVQQSAYSKRNVQYVLMASKKRRILNKLLAIRAFQDALQRTATSSSSTARGPQGRPLSGGADTSLIARHRKKSLFISSSRPSTAQDNNIGATAGRMMIMEPTHAHSDNETSSEDEDDKDHDGNDNIQADISEMNEFIAELDGLSTDLLTRCSDLIVQLEAEPGSRAEEDNDEATLQSSVRIMLENLQELMPHWDDVVFQLECPEQNDTLVLWRSALKKDVTDHWHTVRTAMQALHTKLMTHYRPTTENFDDSREYYQDDSDEENMQFDPLQSQHGSEHDNYLEGRAAINYYNNEIGANDEAIPDNNDEIASPVDDVNALFV